MLWGISNKYIYKYFVDVYMFRLATLVSVFYKMF